MEQIVGPALFCLGAIVVAALVYALGAALKDRRGHGRRDGDAR
ncbi:MAG: hypothetical protein Q4B30_03660 [Coriobacteriaceae bacterium]|nr:hypothetical protein [Coriobacteriaceae bacterium]